MSSKLFLAALLSRGQMPGGWGQGLPGRGRGRCHCQLWLNRRSAFSWSEPVASIQPEKPTFSVGPAQQKGGRKSNGRVAPNTSR